MKTLSSFLSFLVLVIVLSCNDKLEESFTETETDLNIVIPISPGEGSNLNKSAVEHPFSGTNEIYVANIIHQEITIYNIYDVKPRNGSFIRFSEIPEDHGVNSLVLTWNYTSINNPTNNIEESIDLLSMDYIIDNDKFQINIDSELANLINGIEDQNGRIKIEITGTCSNDLNCIASLHIPITVTSKIYSPRFELTF